MNFTSADAQRIAVIGNAGGGKSTLARRIGAERGIPVHVVDDVQWLPGWVPATREIVATAHAGWMAEPRWIVDGWGAWDLIVRRFAIADTIVVVDLAPARHVAWAMKRQMLAMLGRTHGWPPPGCRALPVTLRMLRTMRSVHRDMRPRLMRMVEAPALAEKTVVLRSPRDVSAFR